MATQFKMPDIGEGLAEGEIVRWLVEIGDETTLDEPFVEIETDKAVMAIPAPSSGVLLYQAGPEGAIVQVGEVLAVFGDPGEQWSNAELPKNEAPAEPPPIVGTLPGASRETTPSKASHRVQKSVGRRFHAAATASGATVEGGVTSSRPLASPPTRKLAADLGVDLRTLRGTGPGGRILRADVERAAATGRRSEGGSEERVKLSGRRRAISERMSRSWREIPHVTIFESAEAERLMQVRGKLADHLGVRVPLEALMIKAVIPVLREYAEFNAAVDGDEIIYKCDFNIGFSVDSPEGLLVPVIHKADSRDLRETIDEVMVLAAQARDRSLTRQASEGLTFTVSNIGAVGGGYGTPIIPFGTTAILSVGRVEQVPVVRNDQVAVGLSMPLSLSYDHRVIDGGTGRRFMEKLLSLLGEPVLFLGLR